MHDIGDGHDIQEVEMTANDLDGKTMEEVNDKIPGGCLVAEVGQGEDAHVPAPDDTISLGDHVTFLGDTDSVRTAVKRFHPRD